MLKLLGRYWRGFFRAADTPEREQRGQRAAKMSSLPEFRPREGEVIHGCVGARGYDEGREVNLGEGRLLVTSKGIVYMADTGKWRFHWHRLAQVTVEDDRSLALRTHSGSHFSFRLPSVQEAEAMMQAAMSARGDSARTGAA
jgi:hypothetical protein